MNAVDVPFTRRELDKVLGIPRHSRGDDGIPYQLYSKAPSMVKDRILHLFNRSWREGILPAQ